MVNCEQSNQRYAFKNSESEDNTMKNVNDMSTKDKNNHILNMIDEYISELNSSTNGYKELQSIRNRILTAVLFIADDNSELITAATLLRISDLTNHPIEDMMYGMKYYEYYENELKPIRDRINNAPDMYSMSTIRKNKHILYLAMEWYNCMDKDSPSADKLGKLIDLFNKADLTSAIFSYATVCDFAELSDHKCGDLMYGLDYGEYYINELAQFKKSRRERTNGSTN